MMIKKLPALLNGKPVRKNFLIFGNPQIKNAEIQEVIDTLKSGWLSYGPKVQNFEDQFKKYIGCKYAIALNSCTAGLYLALQVAGIGKNDEVVTSPLTFAATANAIIQCGAKPVFVDVEKGSFNINPKKIKAKITNRTKAIIPVHFGGIPCNMEAILKIAKSYNLIVIEDAAHALETYYHKRKVGTISHATVFSFYVNKNVTTGEGGMVTTNNAKWAKKIKEISLQGVSRTAWDRYTSRNFVPYDLMCPGFKYNMMDIQAAIGIHQLARVEENLKLREKYWKRYNNAFITMPEIIIPQEWKDIKHARHLYTILLKLDLIRIDRNTFIKVLKAENIGTGIHFISLHLHSYFKDNFNYKRGDFPVAEYISDRTVSLPLSPKMTLKDVDDVIKAVKKVIAYYRK